MALGDNDDQFEVLTWPDKTPGNVVDYDFNYTKWLLSPDGSDSDAIVSSTWVVASGDVAINTRPDTFVSPITKVWASGGTVGTPQVLTNNIVTALGRSWSQTATFNIRAQNNQGPPC